MDEPLSGSPLLKPGQFIPDPGVLRVTKTKIVDYLLNLDSKDGGSKARFFLARGFSVEGWTILANAFRNHAESRPIASVSANEWGVKYVIDCTVTTPNDSTYCIRVVWNDHYDDKPPKLITAHPLS